MKKYLAILACALLMTTVGCKPKTNNTDTQASPQTTVNAADPNAPAADPNAPAADPNAPAADPNAPAADPNAPAADPNAPAADPNAPAADPNAPAADPNAPAALPGDVAPASLAIPENATKTESGLAILKLKANDAGQAIKSSDLIKVVYSGWTMDGHRFDASELHGDAAYFEPEQLIPGMKEALELSKEGEKIRVWIPENLAYNGAPGAPAGMLVFDFDIQKIVTPVMPPKDIPEDAIKLDGGLAYRIISSKEGGKAISENDLITLNFAGWKQADGRLFHSTLAEGQPLSAPANTFFPAWKAILPKLHEGDVFQTWVPQELGIAAQAPADDEMAGTLIFEVTIESVVALPAAPADVAAPPADAEKTASGLASKVISAGTGTKHPTPESIVQVHYSGWTTDGQMFDSTSIEGEPVIFPLGNVIAGWTEGVQLMVEGEKRRLWIPEELAYKGQPGAPAGMLVFDVELVNIIDLPAEPAVPAPAEIAPAPAN